MTESALEMENKILNVTNIAVVARNKELTEENLRLKEYLQLVLECAEAASKNGLYEVSMKLIETSVRSALKGEA